jgi:structural maintenance of chromosomes protein 6
MANLTQLNSQISGYEKQIADETRKLAGDSQQKRQQTQQQLQDAKVTIEEAQSEVSQLAETQRTIQAELDDLQTDGNQLEGRITAIQSEIHNCEGALQQCMAMEKNKYAAYGRNIQQLLNHIQNTRWQGDVPLGPLGLFVQAKDPQKWGDLLRSQLGSYLLAFAVTNSQDMKTLKRMLVESNK